jgi:HDOD domain
MAVAGILIGSCIVFAGWLAHRWFPVFPLARQPEGRRGRVPPEPTSALVAHLPPSHDVSQVESVNQLVTQRLWRLAFGAVPENPPLGRLHARVRELICAKLQVDCLSPEYFPRRPTLMPQLLKALDDPRAESEKLSRIIAHDPVLAAEVLRLANSSLYRMSPAPVETIQRAIVVCGVEALRGMVVTAMLRPVFRASRTNFPRLPRMLWDRTERAARAAELYATTVSPQDRFEAQLTVLLNALGPLVVYGTTLDAYASVPNLVPDPALCVELIGSLAPAVSQRIAHDWQTSPRLLAALDRTGEDPLTDALCVGELLGTLSFLESQTVLSPQECLELMQRAGLIDDVAHDIWTRLAPGAAQ